MGSSLVRVVFAIILCMNLSACYNMRSSSGGGQTSFDPPRRINAADVAVPQGYRIEPVATGLTFPTGVAFDEEGGVYVTESGYSYGEVWTAPRLLKVEPGSNRLYVIAEGGKNGPWTGVVFQNGSFYVAEGGVLEGGRILRISNRGEITPLIEGLPSRGDHHTNGPAVGRDGWIYFGVGTATNSAVVGEDNAEFGWLKRDPAFHDIPCQDITLAGVNYTVPNPLKPGSGEMVSTGAFSPFGTATQRGQVIRGEVPCSGAVMRISPNGGRPEVVAWGFRNPFGLAFNREGNLFVTDNMYDERGSRPVYGAGDLMWRVTPGTWYGWPDFHAQRRLNEGDRYKAPGKDMPQLLLQTLPNTPPDPVAVLGVHSSSNGFDFSRNSSFGYEGQAFVAQFGDQAPNTGKVLHPVGFKVVRVDPENGVIEDFAANRGKTNGPASWMESGGLERPIAARFDPNGSALYVVDFGVLLEAEKMHMPQKGTGVLWRITRTR
jgi:glucose/arabinose dehydrogenase